MFAFYAERLGAFYEARLAACGLDNVVIGYRKGSSNIKLARDAFAEIQSRGSCIALALDIKGFFDNICHDVLKNCWAALLAEGTLPEDHYKVFRALTTAGKIDRAELLRRLGFPSNARDRELPRPLCSIVKFRHLRAASSDSSKLVCRHAGSKGIPQGTPLSAIAANISMLEFDAAVHAVVSAAGGSYRRYSDDILILCSPEHITALEAAVEDALKVHTKTLALNADKREEVQFCAARSETRPLPAENIRQAPSVPGVYLRRSAGLHTRRNALPILPAHVIQCARGEGQGRPGEGRQARWPHRSPQTRGAGQPLPLGFT